MTNDQWHSGEPGLQTEAEIDWDTLTPEEARQLLTAFDDWLDHNDPDDEDIAEYERLREIANR